MSAHKAAEEAAVRASRFPLSVFFIYLLVLLLMSGIHTGLIVLIEDRALSKIIQTAIPILYWSAVAGGLTLFTRWRIKKTYDIPMRRLADATSKVARGDFSIFVAPTYSFEKHDYLDVMIMDFNKMVEELGSIETLKTDFVANVSHEIKTPLSIIKNYTTLLKTPNLPPEAYKEYINTVIGATDRMAALVSNILKLNKLENQQIDTCLKPYNLCAQLCECALQFEALWEEKGITFDVEIEDCAVITADDSMLELVWNNLLSNALKFTNPGGTVTLRQRSTDQFILVSVSDTGCGMDDNTIRHIFDKFYQGDTSHSGEGNGLGLALAHRVVERLGGSLIVESQPKLGSIFTVKIPV